MLSLAFIRENPEVVRRALQLKGEDAPLDKILDCDRLRREAQTEHDSLAGHLKKAQDEMRSLTGEARQAKQGELRTLMLSGHYESKEEAAATVEQAKSDLERLERQAAAARRLWETLSTERRRVVEKLTAPVTLRVRPYLQELFPGCGLDAGEGPGILGLQSEQLKEPFDELSGGAQEQISLVTRIGLAEVLAAEGTLPLILDDALVNTDPERVRRDGPCAGALRPATRVCVIE